MIAADELLMLKARLLVGAEAAGHIASSADPVRYDQEQYEAVHAALLSMKSDITRVLAEIDVLRGMVLNSVSLFLAEERKHGNGLPESGGDVGAVPAPDDHGGGKGNLRTPRELMSEFRSAGLLGNEPSDPTPEEIREGMEYFRSQWDAATEASRWIAARTTESVFV